MTTLAYTDTLVIESCPTCGVVHGVPDALIQRAKERRGPGGRQIYCPNGHTWHYTGETDAERERRLRKYAEDSAASARARADQAEASLRTTKGHVTRLRKRVAAGVCPFGCRRHFVDVERHVATRHPGQRLEGEA